MKKLTVFLTLLMCVSFAEMSAQTIRWEVSGNATLQIRVNGITQLTASSSSNGMITVAAGDFVEVIATSTVSNYPLVPIIAEDDSYMIERAAENDYNFLNEEHTSLYEWFTMPDEIPMYIGMNS